MFNFSLCIFKLAAVGFFFNVNLTACNSGLCHFESDREILFCPTWWHCRQDFYVKVTRVLIQSWHWNVKLPSHIRNEVYIPKGLKNDKAIICAALTGTKKHITCTKRIEFFRVSMEKKTLACTHVCWITVEYSAVCKHQYTHWFYLMTSTPDRGACEQLCEETLITWHH